jgi:hypothetical protein
MNGFPLGHCKQCSPTKVLAFLKGGYLSTAWKTAHMNRGLAKNVGAERKGQQQRDRLKLYLPMPLSARRNTYSTMSL